MPCDTPKSLASKGEGDWIAAAHILSFEFLSKFTYCHGGKQAHCCVAGISVSPPRGPNFPISVGSGVLALARRGRSCSSRFSQHGKSPLWAVAPSTADVQLLVPSGLLYHPVARQMGLSVLSEPHNSPGSELLVRGRCGWVAGQLSELLDEV